MNGRILLYICLALLGISSCISHPSKKTNIEQDLIDSFLISRFDSIYTYPALMEKRFRDAQQGLTDSSSYYRLQLFYGYCRYLQGDAEQAFRINREVMNYATGHAHQAALEAMCWNHRYALLQGMNQRDSAIACLHHAYDALYRSDDRRELENVCINLADLYRQKGNWADAARYYRKALWVVDSLGSERVRFSIYVGLAQVYADLHNFRQAHYYFDLAEQNQEYHLEYEKYYFQNSKGNCYYFEERYPEALACFKEAYRTVQHFQQPSLDALVEANIGEIYTLMGEYDSAHHYLDKSYAYFENDPTANEEVVFYLNSLQAALALREHKLGLVDRYLSKPFNPEHIGPSFIYLHNKRFMEYYAQQGNYKKAYEYQTVVEKYDDSIRSVRHTNNIAEIDYRYRQDTTLLKRDILIANNRVQLSHQRTTIILVVTVLTIFILLATLAFLYIRRKNERAYNRQLALVTRLRMENVKNRISPHYMFNVLNTIMPAFKQYADLSQLLQRFIQVLRGNLLVSDQLAVELQKEIELVKNFVALRQETNPNTVKTTWHIDPSVDQQLLVPSMCIQIPVENSLKYAFDAEPLPSDLLSIDITRQEHGILISIRDNGCGYNPGKQNNSERGTGNGLKILFRTVEMLNARNVEKMRFDIQNLASSRHPNEKGTLVTLFVPFNYQFKF